MERFVTWGLSLYSNIMGISGPPFYLRRLACRLTMSFKVTLCPNFIFKSLTSACPSVKCSSGVKFASRILDAVLRP